MSVRFFLRSVAVCSYPLGIRVYIYDELYNIIWKRTKAEKNCNTSAVASIRRAERVPLRAEDFRDVRPRVVQHLVHEMIRVGRVAISVLCLLCELFGDINHIFAGETTYTVGSMYVRLTDCTVKHKIARTGLVATVFFFFGLDSPRRISNSFCLPPT